MLSLPFVERDSNVGEEPGLEREGAQEQLGGTGGGVQGGMYVIPAITTLCPSGLRGVDSRSTSASCVGSNPPGVTFPSSLLVAVAVARRGGARGRGGGSEALLDPISPTPETQTAEVAFSALGGLIAFNASLA